MSNQLYSTSWHRVSNLIPRIKKHTQFHRHHYRGALWHVLEDKVSGKVHRFSPSIHSFIGLMNGKRTIQAIWDQALENLGDEAPTQNEIIHLLSQLHSADVLQCNVMPNSAELFLRHKTQKNKLFLSRILNPMAIRIPLFDPDKFLNHLVSIFRIFPGWLFALVWGVIVLYGIVQASMHWGELTENVTDLILSPQNLFVLWLLFPIIKAFHELGHAFAVKRWGGEVHEIGAMFLVLLPIPYVDATAAASFRSKTKRIMVGAAGMMVEVFIASLALFIWLSVDNSTIHMIAYNTMLIAGISTILFNANPLLRFDGYYILSDLIEIPNLNTRANNYIGYLCQRYLFGTKSIDVPNMLKGERVWMVLYSTASFVYRMFVVAIIAMFISTKFFIVGVILALWSIFLMVLVPLGKAVSKIFTDPKIRPQKTRALLIVFGSVCVIAYITFAIPINSWTRAEGVVWVEGNAFVRAETDCFIQEFIVKPGQSVQKDDLLIRCQNDELIFEERRLQAKLEELNIALKREQIADLVQTAIIKEEINNTNSELNRIHAEIDSLSIRSKADGLFVAQNPIDWSDKYVNKGESLGYVVDFNNIAIKVAIKQNDIDLVRQDLHKVEIRKINDISNIVTADIKRIIPAAVNDVPVPTLTTEGGGELAIDPTVQPLRLMEKVFLLELNIPDEFAEDFIGNRVYVKFYHGLMPVGQQLTRTIKQLFLGHFDV